jgi:Protein of unknown function (DUF2924)
MNVERELALLGKMTAEELRAKYFEVFGEASITRHKGYLVKRIIWRMQANVYGGLSERALARAKELANPADLRLTAPKAPAPRSVVTIPISSPADRRLPSPGTFIERPYKGKTLRVKVVADGFEYEEISYKSLSAVAKKITGQHMNGFLFFRLKGAKA